MRTQFRNELCIVNVECLVNALPNAVYVWYIIATQIAIGLNKNLRVHMLLLAFDV
jgi:hypothetical protein